MRARGVLMSYWENKHGIYRGNKVRITNVTDKPELNDKLAVVLRVTDQGISVQVSRNTSGVSLFHKALGTGQCEYVRISESQRQSA